MIVSRRSARSVVLAPYGPRGGRHGGRGGGSMRTRGRKGAATAAPLRHELFDEPGRASSFLKRWFAGGNRVTG
jgi:hypothetical protein